MKSSRLQTTSKWLPSHSTLSWHTNKLMIQKYSKYSHDNMLQNSFFHLKHTPLIPNGITENIIPCNFLSVSPSFSNLNGNYIFVEMNQIWNFFLIEEETFSSIFRSLSLSLSFSVSLQVYLLLISSSSPSNAIPTCGWLRNKIAL